MNKGRVVFVGVGVGVGVNGTPAKRTQRMRKRVKYNQLKKLLMIN